MIEWHEYPEESPQKDGFYLVSLANGNVSMELFMKFRDQEEKRFSSESNRKLPSIVAWADMPMAYRRKE